MGRALSGLSVTAERPDIAELTVGLAEALRQAGVGVTPDKTQRFVSALGLIDPQSPSEVYWTARIIFVSKREELAAFDAVLGARVAPPGGASTKGHANTDQHSIDNSSGRGVAGPEMSASTSAGLYAKAGEGQASNARQEAVLAVASPAERLSEKHLASLDHDELAAIEDLMRHIKVATPTRRSRRRRRNSRGAHLDLRATVRASLRTGGDPITHQYMARRRRRRPLVLICDVSGSMEPYSRVYLQLLQGAAAGASAEAFVFATRLTRLTRTLQDTHAETAIRRAGEAAPDWSGGTRIGDALKTFNARYGRRGMARGAVVVILSDGWECGDAQLVAAQMQALSRLAHRIIWVNPRASAPGFEPLVAGMAAALPYCDQFVSGHSLGALHEVVEAIGRDRS